METIETQECIKKEDTRTKKKRWLLLLLLLLLISAAFVLVLHYLGYIRYPWESAALITGNVKAGHLSVLSDEELAAELQKKADDSQVSFKINGAPVFNDANGEGSLYIANPEYNTHAMAVNIYLDETEELIYESGRLDPGYYIDYDYLKVPLEAGLHEATAYIEFHKDNKAISKVAVSLEIKINH